MKGGVNGAGFPAKGPREALRERLFFSGRLMTNDTTDVTNLITVDSVRGNRANPAMPGNGNPPRHHSSPIAGGSGPGFRTSGISVYDILRKWEVKFSGAPGDAIDVFIAKIEDRWRLVRITDTDLLDCIPLFLSRLGYHWYKIERPN